MVPRHNAVYLQIRVGLSVAISPPVALPSFHLEYDYLLRLAVANYAGLDSCTIHLWVTHLGFPIFGYEQDTVECEFLTLIRINMGDSDSVSFFNLNLLAGDIDYCVHVLLQYNTGLLICS